MGDYRLSKNNITVVIDKVNNMSAGNWNWSELGWELEDELYNFNWEMMQYKDDTTYEKYEVYKTKVSILIKKWVILKEDNFLKNF